MKFEDVQIPNSQIFILFLFLIFNLLPVDFDLGIYAHILKVASSLKMSDKMKGLRINI